MPYKSAKPPYREYSRGVGPYSETSLCRQIAEFMATMRHDEFGNATTKKFPDLLVPNRWAIELKIARPFGDNGKEAEHWSQNLLHPYAGNTSSLSDAMKLATYTGPEVPVIVVIGYEHSPAKISLEPLITSFEVIAQSVLRLPLGSRHTTSVPNLLHAHHQLARLWAWEVRRSPSPSAI